MYYSTYNIHYIKNRTVLPVLMEGMSRIAEGNPYNPTSTHGNVYWLFGQYLDKRCSSSPHHPLLTNLILTRSLLLRKFPSPNPLTYRNWFGLFNSSSSLSSPRWAIALSMFTLHHSLLLILLIFPLNIHRHPIRWL